MSHSTAVVLVIFTITVPLGLQRGPECLSLSHALGEQKLMQEPPKEKQKEKDAVGFPVWKLSLTPPTTYHHVGGFRKHKRISLRFCRLEVQVSLGLNPGVGRAVFLLEALAADFRGSPHLPEVASCSLLVSWNPLPPTGRSSLSSRLNGRLVRTFVITLDPPG